MHKKRASQEKGCGEKWNLRQPAYQQGTGEFSQLRKDIRCPVLLVMPFTSSPQHQIAAHPDTGISKGRECSPSSGHTLKVRDAFPAAQQYLPLPGSLTELGYMLIPKSKLLGRRGCNQGQWAEQTPPTKAWKDPMSPEHGGARFTA